MGVDVAVVRRFNRAWTQRVGALEESYLGSGLPLGASRLLYEIGREPVTVLALRRRLGLDSGYLSRLLRALEADGLVRLRPDPADARRRLVEATARGRRCWQLLEERSERVAQRLVEPLTPAQRARLDEALATAERLVRAATVEVEPLSPDHPDARLALRAYVEELDRRFDGGVDVAAMLADSGAALAPPDGVFLVAQADGAPVACGGVTRLAPGVGELKRMWVAPELRGAGLGARILRRLEQEAARLGHTVVRLDTNSALVEAIAMYERSGYLPIARYNDNPYARHWFEKRLGAGP
jgi:DNA-binding MarR family transcriptional regulator/GNAT superfamily N-acetyltransferase